MKRIILTLAAVILSAGLISAQDMAQATEKAQNANEALVAKDYAKALEGFKEALTLAQACGDEGAELVGTCKSVIPSIVLTIAKNEIKDAKYDEGLAQLDEAIKVAEEYGNDDVIGEAATLIPQVKKQKALALYNAKDYAAAAEAYKEILAGDPEDGASALRLALALTNTGDKDGSIAAFKQAAEHGQAANANKQLANIYLKDAQQLLKDNAKAIGFYEKYLELSPDAKDANGIITTIAVLYQQAGNKAKAIEYYTKVQNDPQYGATAKQQLEALKK